MDVFTNMMSNYQSDALITKEILTIVATLRNYTSMRSFLKLLLNGAANIIVVIVIQYYIKDPYKLINILSGLIISSLYRKRTIKYLNGSLESYVSDIILRDITTPVQGNSYRCSDYIYGFPIYVYKSTGNRLDIDYLPVIHDFYFSKIYHEAEVTMNSSKSKVTIYNSGISKAKVLFPSSNHTNLANVVQSFFDVVSSTGMFTTKGILINGEPGLGKTDSIDYLVSLNIAGEVNKIDMTTRMGNSFEIIVNEVLSWSKGVSRIVLFDEVDKFLDFYIKSSYNRLEDKSITFDQYRMLQKESFLYKMLELLECNTFSKGIIFIFTCNNFESIFENIDIKHFNSLMSRFLLINFHRCEREEFCNYLHFLNDKFENTRFHRKDINEIVKGVEDISITYRDITHMTMEACFDLHKLVRLVNERKESLAMSPIKMSSPIM